MLIAIYICIIGGIFLILLSLLGPRSQRLPTRIKEEMSAGYMLRQQRRRKLYFTYLFLPLNRLILSRIGWDYLSGQLHSAELDLSPEEYLGVKEILILALLAAAFFLLQQLNALLVGIVIFAGFILPDFYLKSRIQKRKVLTLKALPEAIDLLTLCVEGGLDFMLGLTWVVRRSPKNPLINAFALVLQEVQVGKSRQEALKDMARRIGIPEVSSFVNTVTHAERMGTSISEVLNILSEEARQQRFQRGERLALQAPIKMLLPLVVFILPVVGIIVGGPILLQFFQSGMPKF
jgi:pilus assembly protein TadC